MVRKVLKGREDPQVDHDGPGLAPLSEAVGEEEEHQENEEGNLLAGDGRADDGLEESAFDTELLTTDNLTKIFAKARDQDTDLELTEAEQQLLLEAAANPMGLGDGIS